MLETLLGIRGGYHREQDALEERQIISKSAQDVTMYVRLAGPSTYIQSRYNCSGRLFLPRRKRQGKSQCHLSFILALLLEISLGGCGVSIPALQFSSFACLHFNRGFPPHMWLCCWACEILVPQPGLELCIRSTDS